MARRSVVSLDAEKTISLGKDTKYIEGFYLGSKEIPSKKSKTGTQSVHVLETDSGNVGIWGFKKLNDDLLQVKPNSMVYITYKGKTTLNNGNTMHIVKVEFDDEIVRDGTSYVEAANVDSDSAAEDTYEPSEADFEETDQDDEEVDTTPRQVSRPASTPARPTGVSQDQAAKARALLEKHKSKTA